MFKAFIVSKEPLEGRRSKSCEPTRSGSGVRAEEEQLLRHGELRLRHPGAHRSGHQVRPEHRDLRTGLLRGEPHFEFWFLPVLKHFRFFVSTTNRVLLCSGSVSVQVLGRPGFSIADKKRKRGRIGFRHRIRKEEAMRWFQQKVSPETDKLNKSDLWLGDEISFCCKKTDFSSVFIIFELWPLLCFSTTASSSPGSKEAASSLW